jgi:hypothetical protein
MKICDKHGNPIDGGEITPEQEATAQGKAREFQVGLAGTRKVLSADEFASLIAPGVRFEQEFKFPDKSAFFFTINGVLNGKKVEGALFAAECILVWAPNVLDAKDLAQRGVRATVELLHEEYNGRQSRETRDLIQQGVNGPDVGGRRMNRGAETPLPMKKKMEAMVRHVFGGEPFKW